MELLNALKWRYATKKMNGQPVLQEKVDYILEAARLAPSSAGLQPFEIFVVSDKALLEKIKPIANNQSQITDASHVLVFAAWDNYTPERITEVFTRTNAERGIPDSANEEFRDRVIGMFAQNSEADNHHQAAKQAYLSFGVALVAAAEQRVDATPMEGFHKEQLDEALGLKEKGLKSVVIMPLGYRDEANDWLVNLKKVRKPQEQFITELK